MAYDQLDYKNFGDPWTSDDVNQLIDNIKYLYGSGFNPDHMYNSGFFAVTHSTAYTKAHGLGAHPRLIVLQWSTTDTPLSSTGIYMVNLVKMAGGEIYRNPVSTTATSVHVRTGTDTSGGTIAAADGTFSAGGYYRILAWLGQPK